MSSVKIPREILDVGVQNLRNFETFRFLQKRDTKILMAITIAIYFH